MTAGTVNKKKVARGVADILSKAQPSMARAILFGSRARGDARADSDWDILILLYKNVMKEGIPLHGTCTNFD